jgi:hypothetical protein
LNRPPTNPLPSIFEHFAHPRQELEKQSEPIKKTSGQNADQIEPKKQEEDDSDNVYEEDQISDLPKKAEKQFDN